MTNTVCRTRCVPSTPRGWMSHEQATTAAQQQATEQPSYMLSFLTKYQLTKSSSASKERRFRMSTVLHMTCSLVLFSQSTLRKQNGQGSPKDCQLKYNFMSFFMTLQFFILEYAAENCYTSAQPCLIWQCIRQTFSLMLLSLL